MVNMFIMYWVYKKNCDKISLSMKYEGGIIPWE